VPIIAVIDTNIWVSAFLNPQGHPAQLIEAGKRGLLAVVTSPKIRGNPMRNNLLSKIQTHTAQVAIIGLGYVGLPLAVAFAETGFPGVGMDVDGGKTAARQGGRPG